MPKFNPMRRRLPLLKRLVPSLRKRIARHTWTDGFKVVRSGDVRMLVNYRNFVDRQIAFYDDFEREQLDYLLSAARRLQCRTFVDVGANIGYYTVKAKASGLFSRLLAFEPDVRNADQLRANLFLNGLSGAVELHPVALSDRTGKVRFVSFAETSTGQSRISAEEGDTEIEAVRFDELVRLDGEHVLVKIDVEGHELSVVKGMGELLGRNRCFLQVEVFPENLAAFEGFMRELGYRQVHAIEHDRYFTNAEPAALL